jgi:hypothetical protein
VHASFDVLASFITNSKSEVCSRMVATLLIDKPLANVNLVAGYNPAKKRWASHWFFRRTGYAAAHRQSHTIAAIEFA